MAPHQGALADVTNLWPTAAESTAHKPKTKHRQSIAAHTAAPLGTSARSYSRSMQPQPTAAIRATAARHPKQRHVSWSWLLLSMSISWWICTSVTSSGVWWISTEVLISSGVGSIAAQLDSDAIALAAQLPSGSIVATGAKAAVQGHWVGAIAVEAPTVEAAVEVAPEEAQTVEAAVVAPADEAAAEEKEAPTVEAAVEVAPEEAPAEEVAAEEAPVEEEAPTVEAAVKKEAPAEKVAAEEEAPTVEAPAVEVEAPAEEVATDEATFEEATAEGATAEEVAAEQAPGERLLHPAQTDQHAAHQEEMQQRASPMQHALEVVTEVAQMSISELLPNVILAQHLIHLMSCSSLLDSLHMSSKWLRLTDNTLCSAAIPSARYHWAGATNAEYVQRATGAHVLDAYTVQQQTTARISQAPAAPSLQEAPLQLVADAAAQRAMSGTIQIRTSALLELSDAVVFKDLLARVWAVRCDRLKVTIVPGDIQKLEYTIDLGHGSASLMAARVAKTDRILVAQTVRDVMLALQAPKPKIVIAEMPWARGGGTLTTLEDGIAGQLCVPAEDVSVAMKGHNAEELNTIGSTTLHIQVKAKTDLHVAAIERLLPKIPLQLLRA